MFEEVQSSSEVAVQRARSREVGPVFNLLPKQIKKFYSHNPLPHAVDSFDVSSADGHSAQYEIYYGDFVDVWCWKRIRIAGSSETIFNWVLDEVAVPVEAES